MFTDPPVYDIATRAPVLDPAYVATPQDYQRFERAAQTGDAITAMRRYAEVRSAQGGFPTTEISNARRISAIIGI